MNSIIKVAIAFLLQQTIIRGRSEIGRVRKHQHAGTVRKNNYVGGRHQRALNPLSTKTRIALHVLHATVDKSMQIVSTV